MNDVTEMFESAGACLNDLWTRYCRGSTDDKSSCPPDVQDLLEGRLFGARVRRYLHRLTWLERFTWEPLPFLVVAPLPDLEARWMVDRTTPPFGNQYRDAFGDRLASGETALHFLDWFDWEVFGRRQNQSYLAGVARFSGYPEFVGRSALVERRSTQVVIDESASWKRRVA